MTSRRPSLTDRLIEALPFHVERSTIVLTGIAIVSFIWLGDASPVQTALSDLMSAFPTR